MSTHRHPGSLCQYSIAMFVEDGTLCRWASSVPGTLNTAWQTSRDYVRRIGQVKDAFTLGIEKYAFTETVAILGEDAKMLIHSIWPGLVQALEIYAASIGAGAILGGIVGGVLGEGIGAIPGAALGAELGADVATAILFFLGIKFLAEYVLGHLGEAQAHFSKGCTLAWNAKGTPPPLNDAAREFGRAIATLCSLIVEAAVVYVVSKGLKAGLEKLKKSETGRALTPYVKVQYWRQKIGVTDAPTPRKGISKTIEFFEKHIREIDARQIQAKKGPLTEETQVSFMKAMDFSKDVGPETLKVGDKVIAYHDPRFGESTHFFTKAGSSMDRLGIAESTSAKGPGRVFDRYEVIKQVEVLRSYCSGVKDHNTGAMADGGAVQYFFANPIGYLKRLPKN